jgi:membrane fusion protein (multidrug efflux system)
MKTSHVVALLLASLAMAGGGGYWLGTQGAGKAPAGAASAAPAAAKGPSGTPVLAAKVEVVPLPLGISAVGSLRSDESITVRPEIAGRVAEILFREGERVSKGATLLRLDRSVQAADLQTAKANQVLAKAKYDRAVELSAKGFISSQARDEAENLLKVSDATVAQAQARLDKTEIHAPFGGMLGLRQVSVGDYVKEGQDIVNLESLDPLKVDFRVPEVFLKQVQVGQVMQVSLDAFPGQVIAGKVFAINPLVDRDGRAIVIRALLPNNDGRLRPGMFARVRLLVNDKQDSLVIPEQALVPEGELQFVFKVVNGQAVRTRVETGQRREGKVEVVRGLQVAELVVTDGQLKIRDGAAVIIANAPPAGAPGPATGAANSSSTQ